MTETQDPRQEPTPMPPVPPGDDNQDVGGPGLGGGGGKRPEDG